MTPLARATARVLRTWGEADAQPSAENGPFSDRSSEAMVNNPPARAIHPYGRFALDLDSPSFLEPAAEQTTPKLTPVRRYTLPLRLIAAPLPVTTYGSPERRNLLKAAPPLPTYVANSRRFMASGTGRKTHFDGLRGIGRQPGGRASVS